MTDKNNNMPRKIKIGYFDYTIKKNNDMIEEIGLTKVDKLLIEINPNYPSQVLKETLLHECLHAILNDTFIVDEIDEEKLIRILSPAIMNLISQNTDLKEYLFE